jgi:FAD/FMN-containing dehydrogenase
MDTEQAYRAKQDRLVHQLHDIHAQGGPVAVAKRTSNLFRARKAAPGPRLDFTDLDRVIRIDTKKRTAEVEAATTYKDLVAATLKHGLLPAVVPQFVTITVGGAVAGGACEATSFRYGPVHETVLSMTVLLGDGRVVTATPDNEHRDLFYALPNTFGSLGYILKLTVKLVPAKKFVELRHVHFTDLQTYFAAIADVMRTDMYDGRYVDFMDGIILSEHDCYLTIAHFVDTAPYTSDYTYMQIYYRSISSRSADYLTTHDFIWRWDADWAWGSKAFGMQNKLLRLLLGKKMLNSFSYWKVVGWDRKYGLGRKLARLSGKTTERVVQDMEIPIERSAAYMLEFLSEVPVRPIWVCPMRAWRPEPFTFSPMDPKQLYINFGVWGTAARRKDAPKHHVNRIIETGILPYHGYKALYSDVFYSPEEFWAIYDKPRYDALKAKYDPGHHLKDFYQKVVRERV